MLLYQRLERCRDVGGLTLANIGLWLDTPESTIREWVLKRRYPHDYKLPDLYKKLADLEAAIDAAGGRLIPTSVSQRDRANYLRGLINERQRAACSADNS